MRILSKRQLKELVLYSPQHIARLEKALEKDVQLARTVAERFGPVTAKHFGVAKFADLTFPSDDELAAMRQAPNTGM